MKLITTARYPHKALLSIRAYDIDTNTGIQIPRYELTETVVDCKFIVPSGGSGATAKAYSKMQLKSFDRLLSPVDAAGVALFDNVNTLGWEITTVSPIIDMLGFVSGYAYGIKRLVAVVS